jgi:hypothetical protein
MIGNCCGSAVLVAKSGEKVAETLAGGAACELKYRSTTRTIVATIVLPIVISNLSLFTASPLRSTGVATDLVLKIAAAIIEA